MAFLLKDTQDVVAQIFVTDKNLCCIGHLDAEMLKQDLAVCCTQMGHECPPF